MYLRQKITRYLKMYLNTNVQVGTHLHFTTLNYILDPC